MSNGQHMNLNTGAFMRNGLVFLLGISVLAACALPRSGPSRGEILAGANNGPNDVHIVEVSDTVVAAARSIQSLGFGSDFLNAGAQRADIISRGDVLSVTVWENIDNGLLASVGQKVTLLQEVQVDQEGLIFIPYAGRLLARGKTPEQLRRLITNNLQDQTPDPQVEVRRLAGDGATVSIIGGVGLQGVYPIEASTRRLAPMLAKAGGVIIEPDVAQVRILRSGKVGTIWLQDLYDNTMADVALRAGDKIIVEEDRRSYTALGATGGQAQVNFSRRNLSVLEAIAQVGGLNANLADPKGIFIFRNEPNYIANRVLGRSDLQAQQRMAYVIDLTKPKGMFIARDFNIRDGDTIYTTEAPFVSWQKIMAATLGSVNFAGSVGATSTAFTN
jgi:polysaccharide export outer membrane protein